MRYHPPRIKKIIISLCEKFGLDENEAFTHLQENFPELWEKERCANCGASMQMYEYSVDPVSLLLLQKMGHVLKLKMIGGKTFTEANQIHLSTEIEGYTVISHQTITSKLGLIAKVKNPDGTHNRQAGWCITRRGFDCLQDKEVPKKIVVFRNRIIERSGEVTTMSQVYKEYKGKKYDGDISKHNPSNWYNVASYFPGNFIDEDIIEE